MAVYLYRSAERAVSLDFVDDPLQFRVHVFEAFQIDLEGLAVDSPDVFVFWFGPFRYLVEKSFKWIEGLFGDIPRELYMESTNRRSIRADLMPTDGNIPVVLSSASSLLFLCFERVEDVEAASSHLSCGSWRAGSDS